MIQEHKKITWTNWKLYTTVKDKGFISQLYESMKDKFGEKTGWLLWLEMYLFSLLKFWFSWDEHFLNLNFEFSFFTSVKFRENWECQILNNTPLHIFILVGPIKSTAVRPYFYMKIHEKYTSRKYLNIWHMKVYDTKTWDRYMKKSYSLQHFG